MIYKRVLAFLLAVTTASAFVSCEDNTSDAQNVIKIETHSLQERAGVDVEQPSEQQTTESETEAVSEDNSEISDSENSSEPETESVTEAEEINLDSTEKAYVKGNFYGSDGTLITYSRTDEEGNVSRYFTDSCAVSHANLISELTNGLDVSFDDKLTTKNPLPVNGHESVGQSIQLTIDPKIQNAIYDYMAYYNIEGSVVVMRTDGSLAAEVSYPSFDPEYYIVNYDEAFPLEKYRNKAVTQQLPGSCFKIMSEVLADKHGIYTLKDEGEWTDDGATIVNWDHDDTTMYPIEERTLFQAFLNSSNIYFAKTFNQIGYDDVLSDLAEIFHFGDHDDDDLGLDNTYDIQCDFGTLMNNIEFYCLDDLRRSAFGQSYVLTTPVYLAALAREAVFGDMVKPFVVQNIVETNDYRNIIQRGSKPYNQLCSIPQQYRQGLLDGMLAVASNVGLYPFDNYTVYAKTGTAEKFKDNEHLGDVLYITGVIQNYYDTNNIYETTYGNYEDYKATGSYAVVMQITNPEYFEFDFASESSYFYQGILNCVVYN